MGLIENIFSLVFGNGGNGIVEIAEVFRENADAHGERQTTVQSAAMQQMTAEFKVENRAGFERFIDGVNRTPRPLMALGTLGLFASAMVDPTWFTARMGGLTTVPDPLWWLLAAIVSFYFGARHQLKSQEFQKSIIEQFSNLPAKENVTEAVKQTVKKFEDSKALDDWAPWDSHSS